MDDVAHISVMTFSDTAKVVMPLSQMSETSVPTLKVEGGTNYGEAFRELARVIPGDAAALKAQGYRIFRPCAFFLTDGEPNDRLLGDVQVHPDLQEVHGRGHEAVPGIHPVRLPGRAGECAPQAGLPAREGPVVPHQEPGHRAGDRADPRCHHEDRRLERAEFRAASPPWCTPRSRPRRDPGDAEDWI